MYFLTVPAFPSIKGAMTNNENKKSESYEIGFEKFFEIQFQTLRKEIEEAKTREFQLLVGGPIIIPTIQSLAFGYKLDAITLALPLIIMIYSLTLAFVRGTAMRCGRYIRTELESKCSSIEGWETWLENHVADLRTRRSESMLVIAFILLVCVYYLSAVIIASSYCYNNFGALGLILSLIIYVPLGIATIVFSKTASTTRE